jgi:5,10-methylenetetrahydromethanopterin reductase
MAEFWSSYPAAPGRAIEAAQKAEASGWNGLTTVDSQNLSGDPYVFLALAATASEKLGLMTSVTNPVTRHAAVTATSALTVQKLSRGRMVLGIGRGDSALAYLGRAPARLNWFEQYLINVQTYLRGEAVDFGQTGMFDEVTPPIDSLGLADAPKESAIHWAKGVAKPPVEVAATGAKVIGLTARHADRVMFALGADPERIAWGIEIARSAAKAYGRDPDTLNYGGYVNVVCHDDLTIGREIGRAGTSLFARFSVMHGKVNGPASDSQQEVFNNVHDCYDMNKHAQVGGNQTTALTDEFMDEYAIIGNAAHCSSRLAQLIELGVDKFAVAGPNFMSTNGEAGVAARTFEQDVMPELQRII